MAQLAELFKITPPFDRSSWVVVGKAVSRGGGGGAGVRAKNGYVQPDCDIKEKAKHSFTCTLSALHISNPKIVDLYFVIPSNKLVTWFFR